MSYGDSGRVYAADAVGGSYWDYAAFIEVSLLRLTAGRYQEDWHFALSVGVGKRPGLAVSTLHDRPFEQTPRRGKLAPIMSVSDI